MLLYETLFNEAPLFKQAVEQKIEQEKAPLQAKINSLEETVDLLSVTLLMGGTE